MFLVWASCRERVWFFCLHIVIKSTVQPVGLLGAYSTEAARSTVCAKQKQLWHPATSAREQQRRSRRAEGDTSNPSPEGGAPPNAARSRRRDSVTRAQRAGTSRLRAAVVRSPSLSVFYPASPPPTGAVRHFRRTPSVIGFVTSCRYRCGRCGSWSPVLRFSGSPPPLLSSLPPSPSLGGCGSPVADSQTHPCPFPDLGATWLASFSRFPAQFQGGGLEEPGALQRRREKTRRPSAPQPDRSVGRRHGDEADSAHLLGPHAACGRSGLQWHHALWVFLNQRLQRWAGPLIQIPAGQDGAKWEWGGTQAVVGISAFGIRAARGLMAKAVVIGVPPLEPREALVSV